VTPVRGAEAAAFWRDQQRQRRAAARPVRPDRRGALALDLPPPPLAIRRPGGLQVTPISEFDRFVTHPGFGLEPQLVLWIYKLAEDGWPPDQCDLFDDIIENDGHLRSVIAARTLAVAGKRWQVMAGANDAPSRAAADLLERALRETNFQDMIAHILGARYYGFAGAEIDWIERDGEIVPGWFVNVPCRRFRFDELDRPRLLTRSDFEGQPLAPGRWVFAKNGTAGITARSGLMRTATWYALFKRWSWRDWVIYAEKFGIPLVRGIYRAGASEEDKRALEDAVEDIGEAGQAINSDDTQIEIKEAAQGGDSTNLHAGIVHEANAEISKLITGSTLTVDGGGPGSFALGRVHETRSFDLVIADADFVARRFRQDVARPFLAFNGFEGAAVPELILHITRESDPLTRAQLAEKLWQMGLPLDTEQLREDFQFRAPPSGERALPSPPELAPAPAPAGGE
jgi:phage gp29-like protein